MQNNDTPAVGNDSAQTEGESALRGAACSPSSDPCIGKSFTMIGYGGPRLRERVKSEGLVLWSVSQDKGYPDDFTHGWSGCDPSQLYFVENVQTDGPQSGSVQ